MTSPRCAAQFDFPTDNLRAESPLGVQLRGGGRVTFIQPSQPRALVYGMRTVARRALSPRRQRLLLRRPRRHEGSDDANSLARLS
jgi:hypothetical protein